MQTNIYIYIYFLKYSLKKEICTLLIYNGLIVVILNELINILKENKNEKFI